jgi:phage pi2 protein 07
MLTCINKGWPSNVKVKYIDYYINQKNKNLTVHTHFYNIDETHRTWAEMHKNLYKIDGNRLEKNFKIKGGNIEDGIITEIQPLPDSDGKIRSQSSSYILYPKKSRAQWKYYVDGVFREEHSMKNGWTDCDRVIYN